MLQGAGTEGPEQRKVRVDRMKAKEAAETKAAIEAVSAPSSQPAAEEQKPAAAPKLKPVSKEEINSQL